VELIIGITIFSIGLSAIYALLQTTMWNAAYSRHEIVVANLLREQIELVKNVRDTNVRNFLPWDNARIESLGTIESSLSPGIYIVENNFSSSWVKIDSTNWTIIESPVTMKKIVTLPPDIADIWDITKLSIDTRWLYVHDPLSLTGSPYAAYVRLTPLSYMDGSSLVQIEASPGKPQWYTIDARVIIKTRWKYREYDAKSIMTDWIK
jgi:type II secretory pathway pseudopilin PulG